MKHPARTLALVVAGAALGWSGATLAQDETPAPAAVAAGIARAYPGAKVGEVEEGTLELAAFEVEATLGEQELALVVGADGTLAEMAREATQEELPAPVKERLVKLGGVVGDVVRAEQHAQLRLVALPAPVTTWHVALVRKGAKGPETYDVVLGADGAVVSEERAEVEAEVESPEEEQEKDDDRDRGGSRKPR